MSLIPLRRWILLLPVVLAACAAAPQLPVGARIGEPIQTRAVLALHEVSQRPQDHYDQTLLVEARVEAVCQTKGCWMKLRDGASEALVRWEAGCGGQYAFPKDAVGKRVIVQGSYYPKEISPADAEHLREEAGGAVAFPERTHELNASAVLIVAE
jgi:hypothetical protein